MVIGVDNLRLVFVVCEPVLCDVHSGAFILGMSVYICVCEFKFVYVVKSGEHKL